MPLSDQEKEDLRIGADSAELREDIKRLAESHRRVFVREGVVDTDRVLDFLCAFNEFINHRPRKFRRIADHNMKL